MRSGHWRRCSPGVYFVDDRPFTDAARIRAAVWGLGPEAVASGLAAAWWHGITKYAPNPVEISDARMSQSARSYESPSWRSPSSRPQPDAVAVSASWTPPYNDISIYRSCGGRTFATRAVTAHLARDACYRRPPTVHDAERLLVQLLMDAGITGWVANLPVGGYEVDVGFAACKVAVEADGFAFHSDPEKFRKDRVRQNNLVLLGWQVLRFTWLDLTESPERVIAEIRRATCGV